MKGNWTHCTYLLMEPFRLRRRSLDGKFKFGSAFHGKRNAVDAARKRKERFK